MKGMNLTFGMNGSSFRITMSGEAEYSYCNAEFWCGVFAGIMSQHANGGGWEFGYARCDGENSDGEKMWHVQEKWSDGGARLAAALLHMEHSSALRDAFDEIVKTPDYITERDKRLLAEQQRLLRKHDRDALLARQE